MEQPWEADPEMMPAMKNAMGSSSDVAAARIREYLESKNNVLLNIAITGESGSGKSSFLNAFRDVEDDSEDAAPTGVKETTLEVKEYPHPNYPNIIFSDLPGIGTTKFPAKKYLKRVGFKKFDFFIIISADRFRENDAKLAKEIKKMGKNFYFVRSKVDHNLRDEQRKKDFSQEKTLAQIRDDCVKSLKDQGVESPQVFLVSNHDIHLYDFPHLRETLERDLPEHKRDALLLSSPNIFPDIIEKKKKVFRRQIWGLTALSGVVAAVPVPGLSVGVDLALLVGAVTRYVTGFGLNVASLKRTASRTGIPYDELKAVLTSQLAAEHITHDLIMKVVLQVSSRAALMAAEEASRFIPIVGIPTSMALSAVTTYKFLKLFLDLLAEDAHRVSDKVLNKNK
ncbi:interferon-inducible GTPase 5-like [Poecilia formosa]|uniref:Interferon-inducible GTPase 5-like n=1 Tax=Poecilia formosa TaxID=48698 RepID=A0A087Y0X8_POEFO|nr:PREDICTED: interferon-inducible GTPase 5-like [Poecilia formosa]XP_007540485.1 PREDICTED: interferon-inducible GTPase 5-like [Poecilia formosa]XP_016520499.1 PREDICTED: interferon-inducible GTPase 5-like [Poecilia formosa]